jgi:tRNA pseudouridine55 synthase
VARGADRGVHGVVVVDKPRGPTSHDVVARARRALGTRAIGHAGTLDPMASGVLVLACGEATKLVRWLTNDDKSYRARVALGAETDTLDAEGTVVENAPVPALDLAAVESAAARFVGAIKQRPPIFSAIKVDGDALHRRARRGEQVEAPERDVSVRRIAILGVETDAIELEVVASKGFYVRSLARDLARALGTLGHLSALRRTQSGAFTLDEAITMDEIERARADELARRALLGRLIPLADACGSMPRAVLDPAGVRDALHGRAIELARAREAAPLAEGAEPIALVDEAGLLVAIGAKRGDRVAIVRGIRAS